MRVIAGELHGRRLDAPEEERARPMPYRVCEGLLDAVRRWIEGAFVLELGGGALGIEALSCGARRARFAARIDGAALRA